MGQRWLQIQGDPSVRRFLFDQERIDNEFDARLEEVLSRISGLMVEQGVFHAKIHFSSCRVTLWLLADPLRYRVHVKDEFLDPGVCLAYPRAPYPTLAVVAPDAIPAVLAEFKRLRTQDRHLYLRSGSLNLINGYVGLNFSCDGTHYLNYAEFLRRADDIY